MKDSQQMSVEVNCQNNMALKALPPVSVKDTNLFPADNIVEDEMSEESFHLHLSEDEDDEKTEKKEDTKTSNVTSDTPAETEDDILNKFEAVESAVLETADDKLEETLLGDSEEDPTEVNSTDKPEEKDEVTESESEPKLPNGECEKDIQDDNTKDEDAKDDSEKDIQDDNTKDEDAKDDSENSEVTKECVDSNKINGDVSESSSEKEESDVNNEKKSSDKSEEEAQTKAEVEHQKENAEILKNQIMDTEDLLQIVDKDTEETNDKDSSGENSPRSVDKTESEDTEMECNDTETEKMDHDEEEDNEMQKGTVKDEDGVDIDENIPFKGDFDSEQLDKEYENIVKSKDLEDDLSDQENSSEAVEGVTVTDKEIESITDKEPETVTESQDVVMAETNLKESMEVESSVSDEESDGKCKEKENEVVQDNEIDTNEQGKECSAIPEQALEEVSVKSPAVKSKEDESDTVTTDSSLKSSKRSLSDSDEISDAKKLKLEETTPEKEEVPKVSSDDQQKKEESPEKEVAPPPPKITALNCISKYMQTKTLKKLTRNDLEQICLMKMCEAICHKSEIGELRHQLGVQEQMIEMWRKEAAQLTKQARDLEIVNKRLLHEVRLKNERDKPLIPVKITRSVGLQVRSDNNMINNVITPKRRLNRPQPTNMITPAKQSRFVQNRTNINNVNKITTTSKVVTASNKLVTTSNKLVTTPNKVVTTPNKVVTTPNKVVTTSNKVVTTSNKVVTNTPAKVATIQQSKVKTMSAKSPSSLLSQALQNSTAQAATTTSPATTVTTPSHVPTATSLTPTITSPPILTAVSHNTSTTPTPTSGPIATKNLISASPKLTPKPVESRTFIDLTDEDDKKPILVGTATPTSLATSTAQGVRIVSTPVKAGNVVTSAGVVNPPRIMYVYNNQLHQGVLSADPTKPGAQKLMLKLNSNVIGSANGVLTAVPNGSAIAVSNASAIRAGQVQPVRLSSPVAAARNTTSTAKTVLKHPAPLPPPPTSQLCLPARKPIPPKPHLSIRRSSGGIVLSWKMPYNLDNFESIASYQLYAYQETTSPPSSDMWRKVGDVKALALPMACTLTQFADGNKYHFAVRAVDVQKRMGPFSDPEQILL